MKGGPAMSIYEFLERLEADPFDPALLAVFGVGETEETEGDV